MMDALMQFDSIEWVALITGIAYAIFSALNKPICWVFGIISCGAIAYKDFYDYNLLFDGALQLLYVIMGVIGLYRWFSPKKDEVIQISSLKWTDHLSGILISTVCAIFLVFLIKAFFNPSFALIDAFTTMFSIWATWLLINRVYENWIYWIIIDVIYIWIFWQSGATLISMLYGLYTITAITGLILWRKIKIQENELLNFVHH